MWESFSVAQALALKAQEFSQKPQLLLLEVLAYQMGDGIQHKLSTKKAQGALLQTCTSSFLVCDAHSLAAELDYLRTVFKQTGYAQCEIEQAVKYSGDEL